MFSNWLFLVYKQNSTAPSGLTKIPFLHRRSSIKLLGYPAKIQVAKSPPPLSPCGQENERVCDLVQGCPPDLELGVGGFEEALGAQSLFRPEGQSRRLQLLTQLVLVLQA